MTVILIGTVLPMFVAAVVGNALGRWSANKDVLMRVEAILKVVDTIEVFRGIPLTTEQKYRGTIENVYNLYHFLARKEHPSRARWTARNHH